MSSPMAGEGRKVGTIEKEEMLGKTQFEWTIDKFSSIFKDEHLKIIQSPNFDFQSDPWGIDLSQPYKTIHPDCFIINLRGFKNRKYVVEYNIAVRYVDGSELSLDTDILAEKIPLTMPLVVKDYHILLENSDVASSSVHILCTLKKINSSTQRSTVDKSKCKKLIRLDTLSKNLKSLFSNKETCDTVLNVKDKEYKAHRALLMARSSVFSSMFLHDTSEKQTGIVNIPDCDPDSFEQFLEFLYSGKLEVLTARSALHLYEASNKYDVQELKVFSGECLKENLTAEILCDAAVVADKQDDSDLLIAIQSFFNKNLSKVFETPEWRNLMKNHDRLANKLLTEMAKARDEVPKK